MHSAALTILLVVLSYTVNHAVVLREYSYMVADLSLAQRRCGFHVNWEIVVTEGRKKDVDGKDLAQLDRLVSQRTVIIEESLSDEAARNEWCNDAILGYGPDGLNFRGILKP